MITACNYKSRQQFWRNYYPLLPSSWSADRLSVSLNGKTAGWWSQSVISPVWNWIAATARTGYSAAVGCRYVVPHETGHVPDQLLTFSPFHVFSNIIAPFFHTSSSICLSSVQVAVTHTLPLWHLQVQVSEASRGLRCVLLHTVQEHLKWVLN